MNTLINVVVVLAMIAIAAFVIHLLNTRHRHQHLRPAHYDHGLAGFGDGPASGPAPGTAPGRRDMAEGQHVTGRQDVAEREEADASGSGTDTSTSTGTGFGTGADTGPSTGTDTGPSTGIDAGPSPNPNPNPGPGAGSG
ncbi:hypothetical protein ACF1BP_17465 [Streptomyces sp. NPDC014735]|uniref:hypothetical protein n=1 Tax=unclassified Streptomyces TaxID=2593676 RepID=UPI0036FC1F53